MQIAVLSDLHIGSGGEHDPFGHRDAEFLSHLSHLERHFDRVVLLGDVWETLWSAVPGDQLAELRRCREAHPEIARRLERRRFAYIHGNHDHVATAHGAPDEIELRAHGKRVLFTHGHRFDRFLTRARRVAEVGIWAGSRIRRAGMAGVHRVLARLEAMSFDGGIFRRRALDHASERDLDLIVTGHTHHAEIHREGPRLFLNSGSCAAGRLSFLHIDLRAEKYEVVKGRTR